MNNPTGNTLPDWLRGNENVRGLRNNNPLNLVHSDNKWQGMAKEQNDNRFVSFTSLEFGIRAAMVNIRTYIVKYRTQTPRTIINKWCPDETAPAYVRVVCTKANLRPDEPLRFTQKNIICRLVWAMAFVECGVEIPFNYFERAYALT